MPAVSAPGAPRCRQYFSGWPGKFRFARLSGGLAAILGARWPQYQQPGRPLFATRRALDGGFISGEYPANFALRDCRAVCAALDTLEKCLRAGLSPLEIYNQEAGKPGNIEAATRHMAAAQWMAQKGFF